MNNEEYKFFAENKKWQRYHDWMVNYNLETCVIRNEHGKIVSGCMLLSFDKMIILFHLFTLPEERGKGYAKRVVKRAIETFEKSKMTTLLLGTKKTLLYEFFKKLGFDGIPNPKNKNIVMYYYKK